MKNAVDRVEKVGVGLDKTISQEQKDMLVQAALKAREHAYAPYSGYAVGAALLTEDGLVYTGCNIENASYGATNCAERTAFFKAVSEGHRKFDAIAIAGGMVGREPEDYAYPCGVCRQIMMEFCTGAFPVLVVKSQEDYKEYCLEELLPFGFGGASIR
ncbi:MAG: cytidine deaminase [Lachnospiraceae bacterium]|nr:cytidine deaminase [Lachnospiraceae bacterium]